MNSTDTKTPEDRPAECEHFDGQPATKKCERCGMWLCDEHYDEHNGADGSLPCNTTQC